MCIYNTRTSPSRPSPRCAIATLSPKPENLNPRNPTSKNTEPRPRPEIPNPGPPPSCAIATRDARTTTREPREAQHVAEALSG